MSFFEAYKNLKPSIVAIVSRISQKPDFPDIIGTGFIAHSEGIVVTNNHVVEVIKKLPRRKGAPNDEWPIRVMYLHNLPNQGMAHVFFDVEGVGTLNRVVPIEGYHYGPDIPDIGLIYVKARGLPALEIEENFDLNEGEEIFISGYPLGTKTLRAPGWIHQINPVLQRGILAAIQPFPCDKPHGLLIDAMVQGGSSGSPIFNPRNNKVTGLLYGGIIDRKVIPLPQNTILPYENGTSLTLAIPAYIVSEILKLAEHELVDEQSGKITERDTNKYLTLEEMIRTYPLIVNTPKGRSMDSEEITASDVEYPQT